jgi:hypothetical protein
MTADGSAPAAGDAGGGVSIGKGAWDDDHVALFDSAPFDVHGWTRMSICRSVVVQHLH